MILIFSKIVIDTDLFIEIWCSSIPHIIKSSRSEDCKDRKYYYLYLYELDLDWKVSKVLQLLPLKISIWNSSDRIVPGILEKLNRETKKKSVTSDTYFSIFMPISVDSYEESCVVLHRWSTIGGYVRKGQNQTRCVFHYLRLRNYFSISSLTFTYSICPFSQRSSYSFSRVVGQSFIFFKKKF